MKRFVELLLLMMVVFIASCSRDSGGEQDASIFLGPQPGETLLFEYGEGVRGERTAVEARGNTLKIEEKTYFPAEITPSGEPMVDNRAYELIADGPRLTHRQKGQESIIFDLARDTWTVPLITTGPGPAEMACHIKNRDKREILGRVRDTIEVLCSHSVHGDNIEYHVTVASGLGLVRWVTRNGDAEVNEMTLTGIKPDDSAAK